MVLHHRLQRFGDAYHPEVRHFLCTGTDHAHPGAPVQQHFSCAVFGKDRDTNASALLSAKWLRTLCDSVKDSYDYIIFDTPPVGVVGDAAIVSSVCDGTLLVIENGVTKKKTLCQIAAELEKIDTNILGVVQNMVGSKKDSRYYGKGNYGYYYGNNQNKK